MHDAFLRAPLALDRRKKREGAELGLRERAEYGQQPVGLNRKGAPRGFAIVVRGGAANLFERTRGESWNYFEAMRHGIFCELGRGAVDFAAVLRELRAHAYDDWVVVEQDVLPGMGSPAASARRNRDFLRGLGV